MKDAKGHGSDPRGSHAAGVSSLPNDIERHQAEWAARGVRNTVFDQPTRGTVQLADLVVSKDQRGEGLGHQYMQELTAIADRHGRTLTLTPAQKNDYAGTTSTSRLRKFYSQFGFVRNKGRNTDFTISDTMYRKPK